MAAADDALARVGEPLRAAGAEGEVAFGILRRLVHEPGAWGDPVTILVGLRSAAPAALVTMTGPYPAMIVGFADPADVGFADLAGAMLDGDHRPTGVNGARRFSEPFARAFCDIAGAHAAVHRDVRAFELSAVRRPAHARGAIPSRHARGRRRARGLPGRVRGRYRRADHARAGGGQCGPADIARTTSPSGTSAAGSSRWRR